MSKFYHLNISRGWCLTSSLVPYELRGGIWSKCFLSVAVSCYVSLGVEYFNQHLGPSNFKRWSKYAWITVPLQLYNIFVLFYFQKLILYLIPFLTNVAILFLPVPVSTSIEYPWMLSKFGFTLLGISASCKFKMSIWWISN